MSQIVLPETVTSHLYPSLRLIRDSKQPYFLSVTFLHPVAGQSENC